MYIKISLPSWEPEVDATAQLVDVGENSFWICNPTQLGPVASACTQLYTNSCTLSAFTTCSRQLNEMISLELRLSTFNLELNIISTRTALTSSRIWVLNTITGRSCIIQRLLSPRMEMTQSLLCVTWTAKQWVSVLRWAPMTSQDSTECTATKPSWRQQLKPPRRQQGRHSVPIQFQYLLNQSTRLSTIFWEIF